MHCAPFHPPPPDTLCVPDTCLQGIAFSGTVFKVFGLTRGFIRGWTHDLVQAGAGLVPQALL